MFSSSPALSGLALGVIGCVFAPIIHSYSSAGGGQTEPILTNRPTQEKKEHIGLLRNFDVLLAGHDTNNGIEAKLSLHQEKEGKKKWKVEKVTWRGATWQNNWALYYDSNTHDYTFTDKSWTNWQPPCYGSGKSWKGVVACFAWGKVESRYENIWKEKFLKVKLDNSWFVKQSRVGYYASSMPESLELCRNASVSEKDNNNLEISINCKDLTLYKTITKPANSDNLVVP